MISNKLTRWILVGLLGLALWPADGLAQGGLWKGYMAQGTKAYRQRNYVKAENQFAAALEVAEGFGTEDPRLAKTLNHLAAVDLAQGRYDKAETHFQRALAVYEKAHGPDHPKVATTLNNLAVLYFRLGRYQHGRHAGAEPLFKRSLAIREKAFGPGHRIVAATLNRLADLYLAQGRHAEAERFYTRSLAIRRKVLRPDHPDVAQSLNGLARLYSRRGRDAEAEKLYRQALTIRENKFGRQHPLVATSLNNLATAYHKMGRHAEAEPLFKQALAIRLRVFGPKHSEVAQSVNNLAALYFSQRRYAEAEPLLLRSLVIWNEAFEPDHPLVVKVRNNLAVLSMVLGKATEYRPSGEGVKEIYRGFVLIAVPPRPTVKYDIRLLPHDKVLPKVRKALDMIYRKSPFSADKIDALKRQSEILIRYEPGFPEWTRGDFTLVRFVPPPTEASGGKGQDALVLLSRYVVKWPLGELAGAIVHVLVGYGSQHLEGRMKNMRKLDSACEASLYRMHAYQDFRLDKFSPFMINFIKVLKEHYCDDFRRYMRRHKPSQMNLWDELYLDVPKLLALFRGYLNTARR